MSKFFYPRLALTNLKKNSKTYIPYIITCIGTVLMFYNVCSLAVNKATVSSASLSSLMLLGTIVTGIFSTIFLFYTNSFLIKRRKKEFGIFNILGMEKKHIAKVMTWESIFVAGFSIIVGMVTGVIFSKLITLALYKILHFNPNYSFEISSKGIIITAILFFIIFFLTLLNSLRIVYTTKAVDLLHGGNVGEKEPKTKWFTTIIGIITLSAGYILALTVKNPISAIGIFLIAVILVMIGTYCLFTSGIIALLKLLKKNKTYYYNIKHFSSISGMIYRMKQNAIGLANICLMSTAVLVMVSTTVSMFVGMDDILDRRYATDMTVGLRYEPSDKNVDTKAISGEVKNILADNNISYGNYNEYDYLPISTIKSDDNTYSLKKDSEQVSMSDISEIVVLTTKTYSILTGSQEYTLNPNEVLVYSKRSMQNINICDKTYNVKEQLTSLPDFSEFSAWTTDIVYVVVSNNDIVNELYTKQAEAYGEQANNVHYDITFDFDESYSNDEITSIVNNTFLNDSYLNSYITPSDNFRIIIDCKQINIPDFYNMYGGLFFLGIFLGTLFLMATVLIIYYKQIVEGFEDKQRFEIMQKVGMTHEEVKRSINSQILTVFTLPILVAIIHITVAFPILKTLLFLLNLTNVALFIKCTLITVAVFILIYVIVYKLTANVYYNIVNRKRFK